MSNGEVRKVSTQDVQLVQNLIERCLQLYMNKKEVVHMLQHQAKIEPTFTELVWQRLEEQNQEFFKAYHIKLILKDQILTFNKLLEKQAEMMRQVSPTNGAASLPIPNGSHVPLLHQNSSYYTPVNSQAMQPENIHQSGVAKLPGGPSLQPCMQSGVGMPSFFRRDDVSPNLQMNQNSNVGIMHGYAQEPSFMYNPIMPEVQVPSFVGEESNPKPVNEPVVESDSSLFGFLGQIPRNFSFSDLTADFSISSDILDSYARSPYLTGDTEFWNPHGNGDLQDQYSDIVDKLW